MPAVRISSDFDTHTPAADQTAKRPGAVRRSLAREPSRWPGRPQRQWRSCFVLACSADGRFGVGVFASRSQNRASVNGAIDAMNFRKASMSGAPSVSGTPICGGVGRPDHGPYRGWVLRRQDMPTQGSLVTDANFIHLRLDSTISAHPQLSIGLAYRFSTCSLGPGAR